jgi:hypothetical protein
VLAGLESPDRARVPDVGPVRDGLIETDTPPERLVVA